MESFFTTTPRTVFLCLDIQNSKLTFWLNEQKSSKEVKLNHKPGTQWIPAVKIGRPKNRVILNPFPARVNDYIAYDIALNENSLLVPHLHNTVCVTGIWVPKGKTFKDFTVNQVKDLLHLGHQQVINVRLFESENGGHLIVLLQFTSW